MDMIKRLEECLALQPGSDIYSVTPLGNTDGTMQDMIDLFGDTTHVVILEQFPYSWTFLIPEDPTQPVQRLETDRGEYVMESDLA